MNIDKALNTVAQRSQMDIVVRFWDGFSNQADTRYLKSVFLGHARAIDLKSKFTEGLSGLTMNKLVQISMDGPAVNWNFTEYIAANKSPAVSDPHLFDRDSCGLQLCMLYTEHFTAVGWAVNEMLRGTYGLFKDSPTRRADYI